MIKNKIRRLFYPIWNIGIADLDEEMNLIGVNYLKHPYDYMERWFADPFPIEETSDKYVILVEEMIVSKGLGRIARITVNKSDFSMISNETILDIATHLSFPHPIIIDNNTFIYPENGQSGSLKSYQYDHTLRQQGTILDESVWDPVIFTIEGKWWLLATDKVNSSGKVLNCYRSTSPLGGYELVQQITFPDNIARRAGSVFERNGKLVSPAQICNQRYGEGISLQEISVRNDKLYLSEFKRIYPCKRMLKPGFHTFNVMPGTNKVIIDGYSFKNRMMASLVKKIYNW